jgi:hypothetical protein
VVLLLLEFHSGCARHDEVTAANDMATLRRVEQSVAHLSVEEQA